nr:tyrosine-type recombinase/integrase [Candidatus Njordarchaeota archaeon]
MANEAIAVPSVQQTRGEVPVSEKAAKVVSDPVLSKWWDNLSIRSKNTANLYCEGVLDLLNTLGLTQARDLILKLEGGELDPYGMFSSWVASMVNRKLAPKTMGTYVHGARGFIVYHSEKVKIDRDRFRVRVTLPRCRAMTEDRIPEKEQLDLLFNLSNLRAKVALILLVHGLRIGEVAQLEPGDLKLADRVPHVVLRAEITKGKHRRLVPLTQQAVTLLRQYLSLNKAKGQYLIADKGDANQIRVSFKRLLKRAKMDERDNHTRQKLHVFHPHVLRKYAKTMMAASGIQDSFIAAILGHQHYLDQEYFRANATMIAHEFGKVTPHLTLGGGEVIQVVKTKLFEKIEQYRHEGISDEQMMEAMKECFHFQVGKEMIPSRDAKPTPNALPFLMELVEALVPGGVEGVIERLKEQRSEEET